MSDKDNKLQGIVADAVARNSRFDCSLEHLSEIAEKLQAAFGKSPNPMELDLFHLGEVLEEIGEYGAPYDGKDMVEGTIRSACLGAEFMLYKLDPMSPYGFKYPSDANAVVAIGESLIEDLKEPSEPLPDDPGPCGNEGLYEVLNQLGALLVYLGRRCLMEVYPEARESNKGESNE